MQYGSRLEQEQRKQKEFEQKLEKQRRQEQEREEQRRKALEQKEVQYLHVYWMVCSLSNSSSFIVKGTRDCCQTNTNT